MLGSLCLICRYPPAFSCRALRSFCSAIFAEVAGILSTTVGTIPTLHSAVGSRGGTVLRVHFIQHHLCLSNIFCEFQYTLIRYRLSAMATVEGPHVWVFAEAAVPWGSFDDSLHDLLFASFEIRVGISRKIVLPVALALTSV